MPKWQPAPAALIEQFAQAVKGLPGVEPRKMFGYPAVFMNGNMFAGLFQNYVILRLSAADRAALHGAEPFEPMPGRPMREYVVAPASVVESTRQLGAWLERARSFAAELPSRQRTKNVKTVAARKTKSKKRGAG